MVWKSIAPRELYKSMKVQTWVEQYKKHAGNTLFQSRWNLWRTLRNQKSYWHWHSYTINILAPYKKMIGWVDKSGTRVRVGCWSGSEDVRIRQRKEVRTQALAVPWVLLYHQFSSVQSLSRVWLFVTPWTAAPQASSSITNSQSSLKLMSIELVMPSSHLILCHPLSSCLILSQHQGIFRWVSSSYQVAKVLGFQLQHQSFQWIFRTDLL